MLSEGAQQLASRSMNVVKLEKSLLSAQLSSFVMVTNYQTTPVPQPAVLKRQTDRKMSVYEHFVTLLQCEHDIGLLQSCTELKVNFYIHASLQL